MIPNNLKALIVSNCKLHNRFARLTLTPQSDTTDRVLMVEYRETIETIATTLKMLGYDVAVETKTVESDSWYEKIITSVTVNDETVYKE